MIPLASPLSKSPSTWQEDLKNLFIPRSNFLISYRGTITGFPVDGIVELDNFLWLITIHREMPSKGKGWRVGAEVLVNNAHVVVSQGTLKGLGCCFATSMEVVGFSPLATVEGPNDSHTFLRHSVPFSSCVQFLQLVCKVTVSARRGKKHSPLSFIARKGLFADMREALLNHLELPPVSRDIYAEFFDHWQECKLK